jgi:hypothetical protein
MIRLEDCDLRTVFCRQNQRIVTCSKGDMGWASRQRDRRLWLEWLCFRLFFPGRSLDGFSDRICSCNSQTIGASANNDAFALRDG